MNNLQLYNKNYKESEEDAINCKKFSAKCKFNLMNLIFSEKIKD